MKLFGYDVCTLSEKELINELFELKSKKIIFALNPKKIIIGYSNYENYKIISSANYLIPDGYGIVLVANFIKYNKLNRITGFDLMQLICENSISYGKTIFLYGSTEKILEKAKVELEKKYIGIKICGYADGYSKIANEELISKINNSNADILFVALGSIKQECWVYENKDKLTNTFIIQGIGGSFDVISGELKRAPRFFIKYNLEWLYRIIQEPKRIKVLLIILKYIKISIIEIKLNKKQKKLDNKLKGQNCDQQL